MRSHYDLLGVDPAADVEAIKRAFRHAISRYHPDKVMHLGVEFQEMAATRAAELTAAYQTLTDPEKRSEYDALLARGAAPASPEPPAADREAAAAPPQAEPPPPSAAEEESGVASSRLFAAERAGRDDIVRRAVMQRIVDVALRRVIDCEPTQAPGLDLVCVSRSRGPLFSQSGVRAVLMKQARRIDRPALVDAWIAAFRTGLREGPILLLLLGNELLPRHEMMAAIEHVRKRNPSVRHALYPVAVDARDFSMEMPADTPEVLRKLVQDLKLSVV